jgi:hypothetical protein
LKNKYIIVGADLSYGSVLGRVCPDFFRDIAETYAMLLYVLSLRERQSHQPEDCSCPTYRALLLDKSSNYRLYGDHEKGALRSQMSGMQGGKLLGSVA